MNPIIACYVAGIILANTGLVGTDAAEPLDLLQTAAVALLIPLLLFSVNLSRSRNLTGRAGFRTVPRWLEWLSAFIPVEHRIWRRYPGPFWYLRVLI